MTTSLLWFRNDLRLHDHQPLHNAIQAAGPNGRLLAVYCFDPRHFAETPYGFRKTEGFRANFLLESVRDLRRRMRLIGGDLVVHQGRPEDVIPPLVAQSGATSIHLHAEPMKEEIDVENSLRQALPNLDWQVVWGHTLVNLDDLPFGVGQAPDIFTQFRKAVEKGPASDYHRFKPTPKPLLPIPEGLEVGEIPETVVAFGLEPVEPDNRLGFVIQGGETAGLKRLKHYIWDEDRLRIYKETRNGMFNPDDSSKLSPWLSHGCLSPRRVQAEIEKYEAERVKNQNTYWLTFELLWRDFFRVYGTKHGNRLFFPSGPKGVNGMPNRLDEGLFAAWREGRTGLPMVDASMREMNATGFMSNRGRQNVASFFTKHLRQPWWIGAAYYEAMLIDYDVTSNWGNWAYVAGVGSDPRSRYFDVELQLKKYDSDAAFVKHWCPELTPLPAPQAREPYRMSVGEQKRYGVVLGEDYPRPIVDYDRITQQLRDASQGDRSGGRRRNGGKSKQKNSRRRR